MNKELLSFDFKTTWVGQHIDLFKAKQEEAKENTFLH